MSDILGVVGVLVLLGFFGLAAYAMHDDIGPLGCLFVVLAVVVILLAVAAIQQAGWIAP